MSRRRATLFVDDPAEDRPPEFLFVEAWLERWQGRVLVADYSSGGWEHLWNVEGPEEAIAELPETILCSSDWAESKADSD